MKFAVIVLQLVILGVVITTSSVVSDNSIESAAVAAAAVADEDEFAGNKQRRTKYDKTSPSSRSKGSKSKGSKKQTRRPTPVPVPPTSAPVPPTNDPTNAPTDAPTAPLMDIPNTAAALGFTTLVTALTVADLVEALSNPPNAGPFTVFAPTNQAFDLLGDTLLGCLLLPRYKEVLQNILLYHVADGLVLAEGLSNGQMIPMLNGESILINIDSNTGTVTINETAKVETANVMATNGVIHAIDRVLVPPGIDVEAFLEVCRDPPKSRSFTGSYAGLDSEDGTMQLLSIYCENALCNVKLEDFVFTTCIEVTGNAYFGGVAIADGIPEDSLDDFNLFLYCLQEGQLEIDFNTNTPITTLKGNMIGLEDGVIRRTGTGFTYFSNYRGDLSVDKPSVPKTGSYTGTDTEDGTNQIMNIYCKDGMCDVHLGDQGFSTCSAITGDPFFGGIAIARNVPEESLDDFKLDLYCLGEGQTQFGNTPTGTLTGSMIVLKDGIIRRTGPGFTFYLVSDKTGSTDGQIGNGRYFNNGSTTDGSRSTYEILCAEGKCDVVLEDFIFPACFALAGSIYLTGFAIAKDIDQASLGNFSLDIYCSKGFGIDIDMENDQSLATMVSGLEVLEDGILLDINSGDRYFNWYSGGNPTNPTTSLYPNGFYYGQILDNGFLGVRSIYCNENKLCDIVSSSIFSNLCMRLRPDVPIRPFNGVAIVKDVPQDSLDDFDIDLYCLELVQQVDYGTTKPTTTMRGGMVALGNGIVTASDPADVTFFIV